MKTVFLTFTLVLLLSLFFVKSTTSVANLAIGEYDHWLDLNDDGKINIFDVVKVANAYGTVGSPINKTALLLDLLNVITELNVTFEVRLPRMGRLSIPAAAFQFIHAELGEQDAHHSGNMFANDQVECPSGHCDAHFYAPVQLPDGVQITNVTFYWYDYGIGDINCSLNRGIHGDFYGQGLVRLQSYGSLLGFGSSSDTPPKGLAIVDNTYQYWFHADIPPCTGGGCWIFFQYVVIEYKYIE